MNTLHSRKLSLLLGLLPILALFIASVPIVSLHFPRGHDWSFELVRVSEFKTAIANGQYPPFWGENLYGGYGSPIFLFYAPLYLSVASFCSLLLGSIPRGSTLALLGISVCSVFAMKLLMTEIVGKRTGASLAAQRIAIYFFLLNPYLLGNKLLRNANAEYTALSLLPMALYGLFLMRRRPAQGGLVLAMGLALTILAHNLTALVAMTLIIALVPVLYCKNRKMWLVSGGAITLALGLAAFFWLPALAYKSLVRIDLMTLGKFDFHNQFQPLGTFFGYEQFFATGLLVPVVLVSGLSCLLRRWPEEQAELRKLCLFLLGSSLLCLFLQTRVSTAVWETLPFMPLFQFPWRMMGPLAILTSMLAGLVANRFLHGRSAKTMIFLEGTLLVLCAVNAFPHLRSSSPLPERLVGKVVQLLEAREIKQKGLGATVLDEYLPRTAAPRAWRSVRPTVGPVVRPPRGFAIDVIRNSGTEMQINSYSERPVSLQFARWFFPGWTCTVNGRRHDIAASGFGAVSTALPAGSNQLHLELAPPPVRQQGLVVSLLSLLALGVMATYVLFKGEGDCRGLLAGAGKARRSPAP